MLRAPPLTRADIRARRFAVRDMLREGVSADAVRRAGIGLRTIAPIKILEARP